MDFESGVKQSIESGIDPIAIDFTKVYSCNSHRVVAYRTDVKINSVDLGVLTAKEYSVTAERTEKGILLADRALMYVCRALKDLKPGENNLDFISVKFPTSILTKVNFSEMLRKAIDGDERVSSKLCVEFPARVLYEDAYEVGEELYRVKSLGVKTLIYGFGGEYCPIMRLAEFPFDYVAFTAKSAEQMRDDKTAASVTTVINYARGLKKQIIATGLRYDDEAEPFSRADCYGYIKFEKAGDLFRRGL